MLHPFPPDWERERVRNDDSVVLEVRYGDVAIVLLGDVGAATERAILPQLTPARLRNPLEIGSLRRNEEWRECPDDPAHQDLAYGGT